LYRGNLRLYRRWTEIYGVKNMVAIEIVSRLAYLPRIDFFVSQFACKPFLEGMSICLSS
jgi:hypothetical protein